MSDSLQPISGDVIAAEAEYFSRTDVPESFKKAVGVVQVAMGELGLLHRKCYNVAIANAYEGLGKGQLIFRMSIAEVAEWCEFNSRDYKMLAEIFSDLRKTPVNTVTFDKKLSKTDKPRRAIGEEGLLAGFELIEGGIIEYSFSKKMAEILYEPEQYIWMSLATQNKFSSKYELNLYENTIRYLHAGSTGFKGLDQWRDVLGASDSTYDDFKYLNKFVLKPATKGVNDKSGIILNPVYEREKRKVARIKFDVSENPQMQLLDYKEHARIRSTEAYGALREHGVSDMQALYFVGERGEQYALDAIAYVKEKAPTKNPTGYLVAALKQGYAEKTDEQIEQEKLAKERAEESQKKVAEIKKAEAKERARAELEKEFSSFRYQRKLTKFKEAPTLWQKAQKETFLSSEKGRGSTVQNWLKKEGWESRVVESVFVEWLDDALLTEPHEISLEAYQAWKVA